MTVYAVGDVQGCYDALRRLLDRIDFDETGDELWLCGDLVNRGPHSLQVLRFVMDLPRCQVVLGNHDLHLLAVARGFRKSKKSDSFDDVLRASDRDELLDWLRTRPLAYFDVERKTLMVHAGLHPDLGLEQGLAQAGKVEDLLRDDQGHLELLKRMYGNQPESADDGDLYDRARWTINAFTRMRFCHRGGGLDFDHAGPPGSQPANLYPWFSMRTDDDFRIVFGHWSLLGAGRHRHTIALDSGCVYGGCLSAIAVDDESSPLLQTACTD